MSTWPGSASCLLCPRGFLANRASGSVVDVCVALLRASPRKFTVGWPRLSGGGPAGPVFFLNLLCPAHASIRVPSR
jgi:hypothetical protein